MARDFDAEIVAIESEISSIKQTLEALRKQFTEATIEFLRPWFFAETESNVKNQGTHSQSLGRERLTQLKKDVAELQSKTESIVHAELDDKKRWWSGEYDDTSYPAYHTQPEKLSTAICLAAGHLAPILLHAGYLEPDHRWRESYHGNYLPQARPYYPFTMSWTDPMKKTVDEYNRLVTEAKRAIARLYAVTSAKQQHEVQGLWDGA